MKVVGRREEQGALTTALASAAQGSGTALVVRGDAGVGKSILLAHVVDEATTQGFRILRTEGTQTEAHLGWAALHRLLLPVLASLEGLPAPQAAALGSAIGLGQSTSPDRFLVNLATLTLLTDVAARQPLLCVIDDAHWLDGESLDALTFVARRLLADQVALVFAARPFTRRSNDLDDLPRLELGGLPEAEAIELLRESLGGEVRERTARRVVAETEGNPLALLELGRELSLADLDRHANQPEPLPIGRRIEERYLQQVRELPAGCQTLLLLAAAETTDDLTLLHRAAETLGLDLGELLPAEDRGLVVLEGSIAFRHRLVRSSLYGAAPPAERRRAHAALALATDEVTPAELRAWHLSAATDRPDEQIARELELAAERLGARGASIAQVELMVRAARLSPDPDRRSTRLFRAALAAALSNDHRRSSELVREVLDGPGDPYIRLQTSRLASQLLVFEGRFGEMPLRLLEAAEGLDAFSREQSRQTLLDATATLGLARELADSVTPALIAQTIHELAPPAGSPVRATDLLLESYRTTIEDGFVAAAPELRASVTQWVGEAPAVSDVARWSILAVWAALELWDVATLRRIVEQDLRGVRARHALPAVQTLLYAQSTVEILDGRFAAAARVHDEARALALLIDGSGGEGYLIECELRSWQGDDAAARPAIDAIRVAATAQGFGQGIRIADLATAVLSNGHGRYLEAAEAAARIVDDPMPGYVSQGLAELVEATSRIGQVAEAQAAATRLRERAGASGTSLAMGIAARSDALVAPVGEAEALFTDAIRHIGATTSIPHLARSHLLLGEWLRRQRRRADARVHLERAHQLFAEIGASAFADRALTELAATGKTARRRTEDTRHELTPRERQVATLATTGSTNSEIAAQMFISVNTVDYHLRTVYRKLGISSRRDLPTVWSA